MIARVAAGSDPAVYEAGIPQTDAELEASLDLLEAQIRFACFYGPTGKLWRSVTHRKVTDPRSVPQRTSEEAVRLAMRRVTWRTEVLDDCFDPAPEIAPVGLAIVPEPLRGVLHALASTAYGTAIGAGLVAEATAPVMPVRTPLKTARLGLEIADPSGAHPGAPNVSAEVDNLDQ